MVIPQGLNQRRSLESEALSFRRRFQELCVIDDFSGECLATVVAPRSPASGWPGN